VSGRAAVAILIVVASIAVLFAYVWLINRDLIEPETRARDIVVMLGATIAGSMLGSILSMYFFAPAIKSMKEDPKGARVRVLLSMVLFLGLLAGLPWLVRSVWRYRTGLEIGLGIFFGILILLIFVVARAFQRLKQVRSGEGAPFPPP
jgi:hypothetical protein